MRIQTRRVLVLAIPLFMACAAAAQQPKTALLAGSYAGGAGQKMSAAGKVEFDNWDLAQMRIENDGTLDWRIPTGQQLGELVHIKFPPPAKIDTDRMTWQTESGGRKYIASTIPFGAVFVLQLRVYEGEKIVAARQEFYATLPAH